MPGFGVAVAARADGRATGQPIFYRRARFALRGQGSVPLGDAPGRAGAFAGYADLVTWARLDDRATGRPVTVVNLHLHFSDRARRIAGAQTGLGLVAAARARGDRVVVLGDLNAGTRSCPVAVLRAGGLSPVPSRGASFHFGQGAGLFGAIDHVFHGPGFAAAGPAGILRDTFDGVWPSDHHPVWADLRPV
jgi:endonuclease/exonuclease/phosphatase family metal-dependent hydrolase